MVGCAMGTGERALGRAEDRLGSAWERALSSTMDRLRAGPEPPEGPAGKRYFPRHQLATNVKGILQGLAKSIDVDR
jgi:hypothetical protein